ncbi:MAG: Rossmann-like domain-containing protein [Syntrophomonadaceae bacterium]|jgi:uncharacterized protein (DUF4213/DUF364 family)
MILSEVMDHLQENLTDKPKLEKIVINPGFSGMLLDNGAMGIAMNIRSGGQFNDRVIEGFLADKPGRQGLDVARRLEEKTAEMPPESNSTLVLRSLLVALLNALSRPFLNEKYLSSLGYNISAGAEKHASQQVIAGETVTIVGFGGMVRNVAQIAGNTYVSELEPDLFRSKVFSQQEIAYGPQCAQVVAAETAGSCFKASDTVFVTGCTLVSNTMEEILTQCQGSRVIVYGHTAGLYPEPLFKRGVNIISTGRVINAPLMVELLTDCAGAVERFFPQATEDVQIWRQS